MTCLHSLSTFDVSLWIAVVVRFGKKRRRTSGRDYEGKRAVEHLSKESVSLYYTSLMFFCFN